MADPTTEPTWEAHGLTYEEMKMLARAPGILDLTDAQVAAVGRIMDARVAAARAEECERITAAVEAVLADRSGRPMHTVERMIRSALAQRGYMPALADAVPEPLTGLLIDFLDSDSADDVFGDHRRPRNLPAQTEEADRG